MEPKNENPSNERIPLLQNDPVRNIDYAAVCMFFTKAASNSVDELDGIT
jgi:hypothetical protein